MQTTYEHIATCTVLHEYFDKDIFRSLNVSIPSGTRKLLMDLGIVIKDYPGGFHLLCSHVELLNDEQDIPPLRVYMYNQDPNFINYSNLDGFVPRDQLIYFNNLEVGSPDDNSISLQADVAVGSSDFVMVTNGMFDFPNAVEPQDIIVTDASGFLLDGSMITADPNRAGTFKVQLSKETLLTVSSTGRQEKLYYHPSPVWKKPLIILDIFPKALYNVYSAGKVVQYNVQFIARRTTWKYFLLSPEYFKFEDLCIVEKGVGPIFHPPVISEILDQRKALVFESIDKITLSELQHKTLQLVDKYNPEARTGHLVLSSLPFPSPDQLYIDHESLESSISSHVYL